MAFSINAFTGISRCPVLQYPDRMPQEQELKTGRVQPPGEEGAEAVVAEEEQPRL